MSDEKKPPEPTPSELIRRAIAALKELAGK